MSTTETTRCVDKENARLRDPRLEQEPTDMVAKASTLTTGHANFGSNTVVSDDGGLTHMHKHRHPVRLTTPLRGLTGAEQTRAKAEHH